MPSGQLWRKSTTLWRKAPSHLLRRSRNSGSEACEIVRARHCQRLVTMDYYQSSLDAGAISGLNLSPGGGRWNSCSVSHLLESLVLPATGVGVVDICSPNRCTDPAFGSQTHRIRPALRFELHARRKLLRYIEANICEELGVERLGQLVNLKASHFSQVFRATFGKPPHAFVLDMRIAQSCKLLSTNSPRGIADIAYAVGFSSQAHFTVAFRARTGTTPRRWQKARLLAHPSHSQPLPV